MVTFKKASIVDIKDLMNLMPLYYLYDHLDFNPKKANHSLNEFISNPKLGQIWMIEQDSLIIGYLIMTYGFSFECGGREAFIDELFVIENHRGKGIGSQAIRVAIDHGKEIGLKMIRLEVTKTNPDAMKLYLKLGFRDGGRTLLTMPIGQG